MKILPSLSVALLACTATAALAQNEGFDRADANRDGVIDGTEMSAAGGHAFQAWDDDGDGRIAAAEFSRGLHGAWSRENNRLRRRGFVEGWRTWFESDPPRFTQIDSDGNGAISVRELRAAIANARLEGPWQGVGEDGMTADQFRQGLASVGDRDGSGGIDRAESAPIIAVIAVEPVPGITADTGRQARAQPETDPQRRADGERQNEMQSREAARGQQARADAERRADSGTRQADRRAAGSPDTTPVGQVITLREWNTSAMAGSGWSARSFFDTSVRGPSGEEIGDVEDLIVGANGELLALVAEVGGFWDIGDTHVSIPWDAVTIRQNGSVVIPVTEDNVDNYGFFGAVPTRGQLAGQVVSGLADQPLGARAWRVSELIGDLARVRSGGGATGSGMARSETTDPDQAMPAGQGVASGRSMASGEGAASGQATLRDTEEAPYQTGIQSQPQARNPGVAGGEGAVTGGDRRDGHDGYGYVRDVIFADGRIAAVVIDRAGGRSVPRGSYAYPFYGYGYGWTPGQRYYDMPYSGQEADQAEPFAYDELDRG